MNHRQALRPGLVVASVSLVAILVFHGEPAPSGSVREPKLRALAASGVAAVVPFGSAQDLGTPEGDLAAPIVAIAIAVTPTGRGYWVFAADGGEFSFGDAGFHGSTGHLRLNEPVVGGAATPTGRGYWLFAADGGVFSFGDAGFHGSTGHLRLNEPVVGGAATPTGRGYWLFAADGGVFSFGDAQFRGSMGGTRLNRPVVGGSATPSGGGYWLVASDGGVFSFGDARFHGSTGHVRLNEPVVGMAPTSVAGGYWLVARDGGVFTFGDAAFHGSAVDRLPAQLAAVGIASLPDDGGYWIAAGRAGVRVMVAGDVHGEGRVRRLLEQGRNPLEPIAGLLSAADVSVVNLETAVGDGGSPQSKQYVFLAPPALTDAIAAAGVDVVTLANNHALDHGRPALLETIDHARRAGLTVVGAGRNADEAYRPALLSTGAGPVAVIGLSQVVPAGWAAGPETPGVASAYDEARSLAAVRAAAEMTDHVVVVVHWGVEMQRCPSASQLRLSQRLREAGADVVAGHHPHVLQPIAHESSGLTAFSLGNFVWYHSVPPTNETGVLDVTLERGSVASSAFHPAVIDDEGRPTPVGGATGERIRASTSGC